MKTLTRGCTYDSERNVWAVWMNKPKGLDVPDRPLWNNLMGDESLKLKNITNKKGVPMLVAFGKLPPTVRDLNGFLTQMRADLTSYINKKKKEAGLK